MKEMIKRMNQFSRMKPASIPDDLSDYLADNGFFLSPASTKYHGNYEGGLYDHSTNVADRLMWMTENLNLQWQRNESPWIVFSKERVQGGKLPGDKISNIIAKIVDLEKQINDEIDHCSMGGDVKL